jgi:regulation of enolase protein 1 (concanavalin A-like superfamily)
MDMHETFEGAELPAGFGWFNPPPRFSTGNGLELYTGKETDFWQRTHYGFRRDDGHCLLTTLGGDFSISTRVEFRPQTKYDQCGLIVRLDAENWIKVSTEYESESVSRLGSVATNLGYSDWATQDISSDQRAMSYRISKNGSDFLLEHAFDGQSWQQMRVTHLHKPFETLSAGVYACSPIGQDFWCRFQFVDISANTWG